MTSASLDEVEYLITCPICSCEYDEVDENLAPKFLSCSHTVCFQCLKKLQNSFLVSCPLCRKIICPAGTFDISQVPTNAYALHILKTVKAGRSKPAEPVRKLTTPNWCLTCGSIGKLDCPDLHSTLDLTASMTSFETLLTMKEHFSKKKEPLRAKIEAAVEKENQVRIYIDNLLTALKSLVIDVKKMEAESSSRLTELNSLLSSPNFATRTGEEENDAFLSELSSLINSSQPEETIEMLKKKMEDSFKVIETKLNSSSDTVELSELVNQTQIAVKLYSDESNFATLLPCPDLLDKGFTSKWKEWSSTGNQTQTLGDLLLLSHLICIIRKRHGKSVQVPAAAASLPVPLAPSFPFLKNLPKPVQITPSVQDKSIFVLTLKHLGTVKGQVHIQPTTYYPHLVQKLGQFCSGTARPLSLPAGKAVGDVFVTIPLSLSGFVLDSLLMPVNSGGNPFDVELVQKSGSNASDPFSWTLVFMLGKFLDFRYAKHIKSLSPGLHFGRVVEGVEALSNLSLTSGADRSGYTFTLEYKQMHSTSSNNDAFNGELISF